MTDFEIAMARVMTCDGPELQLVDLAITRARTREQAPPRHVLEEMRTAANNRRAR